MGNFSAEQLMENVKNLENEDRWKLLELMYDEYYNTRKSSESKLEERISNLEKDIEFLSNKIGVHDLYFNRIHKEEEE